MHKKTRSGFFQRFKQQLHRQGTARSYGEQIETEALHYLRQQKLQLITRNFHCRFGEIDLVMQDRDTLVFVEVRFRKSQGFGTGADSVDPRKQEKLVRAAHTYLQKYYRNQLPPCRFDVISVTAAEKSGKPLQFDWISAAFDLQ